MNIVITGASSGIGKILSEYFISQNHNVCKISRSKLEGFSIQCDVSNLESVQKSVDLIGNHWTNVDCLICCAGTQWPIGPAMNVNPVEWVDCINTNLIGTYYTIHSFNKLMKNSKIICFSGGGSTSSRPNFSSYAVSKIGVVKLVEILAEELKDNVEINAIAPGAFFTNMTKEVLSNPTLSGEKELNSAKNLSTDNTEKTEKLIKLIEFLLYNKGITGKLISAQWDDLDEINKYVDEIKNSDVYTLRRILPTDRNLKWS